MTAGPPTPRVPTTPVPIDAPPSREMTLQEMGATVMKWCQSKGWEPDEARTFGDECALLHSEISEALEAFRDMGTQAYITDVTFDPDKPFRPVHDQHYGARKPEGVPSEFADLLIRLLHYCQVHGIDLYAEFVAKMEFNAGRPWRHGGRAL